VPFHAFPYVLIVHGRLKVPNAIGSTDWTTEEEARQATNEAPRKANATLFLIRKSSHRLVKHRPPSIYNFDSARGILTTFHTLRHFKGTWNTIRPKISSSLCRSWDAKASRTRFYTCNLPRGYSKIDRIALRKLKTEKGRMRTDRNRFWLHLRLQGRQDFQKKQTFASGQILRIFLYEGTKGGIRILPPVATSPANPLFSVSESLLTRLDTLDPREYGIEMGTSDCEPSKVEKIQDFSKI
jgi:hypothetical protein